MLQLVDLFATHALIEACRLEVIVFTVREWRHSLYSSQVQVQYRKRLETNTKV